MCTYYGFISLFFGFVMMTSVAMIAIDEYFLFDYGPYGTSLNYLKWLKVSKLNLFNKLTKEVKLINGWFYIVGLIRFFGR